MMMLSLLALLAVGADGGDQTGFLSKPTFGFECRPKDSASALPTFEYRIYLKSSAIGADNPAMTRISVANGLPKSIGDTALDDGVLMNIVLPPKPGGAASDPNKISYMLGLKDRSSPSADGLSYALEMLITESLTKQASGQYYDDAKSSGFLTVSGGTERQRFELDCVSIKHRYDK